MSEKWNYDNIPDQSGRVVLVTGGNSGLGFHTCRGLAAKGAQVLLACRSTQKGEQAAAAIRQELPQADVTVVELDLADLGSVQACAETVHRGWERLDLLINNAGVMAIPRQETAQGFEMQFGVNHLGHFALTGQLLPLLLKTHASRVVHVSSVAHRFGHLNFDDLHGQQKYSHSRAYSQSKLANLLFALELHRKLARMGTATLSVAAHPGYAATNLQAAGPPGTRIRAGNAALAYTERPARTERRAGRASTTLRGNSCGGQRRRLYRTGWLVERARLSAKRARQEDSLRRGDSPTLVEGIHGAERRDLCSARGVKTAQPNETSAYDL